MATFAARYGLTIDAIAARLGLKATKLLAFDRAGGPGWLRLALVGMAVEQGERAGELAWLIEAPARDAPAVGAPEDRLG